MKTMIFNSVAYTEERCPHFTQSGEMLIPLACYKSHRDIIILRATAMKSS